MNILYRRLDLFVSPIARYLHQDGFVQSLLKLLEWRMLIAQHRLDTSFPSDLPVPKNDGLYDHLHANFEIPNSISLPVAREPNVKITLADLPGLTILFLYPRTGMTSTSRYCAEIC